MIKFKDINYPRRKEKEIIINLPNEIWKDVCDGYKVSNYGRVLSLAKTTIRGRKYDKILSASKKDNGYYAVSINGNNEYVHRLVAKAFIDNPNNFNEINHKDEDKSNNKVDNLEWCTKSYNVSYSKSLKIKQIDPITKEVINRYDSAIRAAIKNNISASAIYNCLYGKSKTCGGYEWIKR